MASADYISREAAKKKHCEICLEGHICYRSKTTCDELKAFDLIPAADVRPVVLCQDCKHFQVNVSPSGYLPQGVPEWECRHRLRPTDPTDFCSYGEKREES